MPFTTLSNWSRLSDPTLLFAMDQEPAYHFASLLLDGDAWVGVTRASFSSSLIAE